MSTPIKLTTVAMSLALAAGAAAQAAGPERAVGERERERKVEMLERPAERLERSIAVHAERAERRERRREARKPDYRAPETLGVSQSTLEAIASCESGGDPTAVSSDGTYRGKYQFDSSTWAAMGGSGDPAAAPEPEQDMRAAMLYAQSGSSPWPVCGA